MTPTKFNLYASRVRGKQTNTSYPYPVEIAGIDDLKKVAAFDHTAGKFADKQKKNGEVVTGYRSLETFQGMNGDIFDCDNDPENPFDPDIPPEEWKTPADIDAMFPNVESYTVYSRHHMKEKNGKPARPKFHKYYPRRKPLATTKQVTAFHKSVRAYCPVFDKRCLDAAHFIYGVENPVVEYVPGELTLDEFMEQHQAEQEQEQKAAEKPKIGEKIFAGTRNSTLSSAAFTYLKKYGETEKAAKAFMQTAAKCEPPLEDSELQTIWNSAVKGYREKVLTDPNYLTPDEYVAKQFRESLEPQDETDVGQARVLVNHYGDIIRYSTATKWLVYDGRQWKENDLRVQGLVQELTDRQLEEAKKRIQAAQANEEAAAESGDDELKDKAEKAEYFAKQFRGFVLAYRKTTRISATLTEARPAVQIEVSELDKDPFTFIPSHTVVLYTNHLPKVGTTDKGTWDRLVVIPFNASFRGMQGEIKNYAEYLFEHCGGAILLWMIQGAKKYIDAHYIIKQPQAVKNAIERYRDNNDWLDNFLGECCDLDKTYTEKSGELYKRYKEFCDSTGDYRRSLADFKFPYNDFVHLRRFFLNSDLLGENNAPLYPLLDTAETLTQGISASVKNGTSIRGVLKFTSLVNPTQVKAEKEQFVTDYFNPANSGGVAATDQRFDFVPTNVTPYQIPQEQVETVNRQIYDYLGVNAKIISGSYTENEFAAFYESVIEPFALQLSQEFRLKCGAETTFAPDRMEFSSADTKIKLLHEAAPLGLMTVNEARHLLALPPVADGNRRLQSLNYVSAEKADAYQLKESEVKENDE